MHTKLFIPGPIEVHPDVLKAMSVPMVSHRGKDYEVIHASAKEKLKKLFYTNGTVLLVTSSATGMMEGAVRCLVGKRVLSTTCGAFSERWFGIVKENGKEVDQLAVDWGLAIKPEMVDKALATGKYDAIAVTHSETSTGVLNPLAEIAAVIRKYPDVTFMVDAVSSLATMKIEPEKLGIDLIFAGVQKGFGMPPGITVVYVSDRALKKAEGMKNRGYYFDIVELKKYDDKNQTPTTPSISHIYALDIQLGRMLERGLDNHFAKTMEMAKFTREWANKYFKIFPEKGYEAPGLTSISNTRNISVKTLNEELAKRGVMISDGYGKIKEKTFRIAHMGDITLGEIKELLGWIGEILKLN